MKLKYYMRGLGIGIIVTTLILSLGAPKEKLTDKEIIKRAEALGMVMKEQTNKNLDEVLEGIRPRKAPGSQDGDSNDTSTDDNPQVTPAEDPSVTPSVEVTPAPTEETDQKEASEATEQADKADKNEEAEEEKESQASDTADRGEITFTIETGMSSGQVSTLLENKGLVQDAKDFNQYIIDKGKAGVIRMGTYTVPANTSYSELLKIITSAQ